MFYLKAHRKSKRSLEIWRTFGEFLEQVMNVPRANTNLPKTILSSPSILNEFLIKYLS